MEKRICRKCLLQDMEGEEGKAYVKKYTDVLREADRAEDALYEKRLMTCRSCDYLMEATCQACGCYVELRAAAKRAGCSYKKW